MTPICLGKRGSALVESAASSFLIVLTITTATSVIYFSFSKVWAKTALYDGLICIAEKKRESFCEDLVRKRVSYLPIGKIENIQLFGGKGRLTFHIDPNFLFHFVQELPGELK